MTPEERARLEAQLSEGLGARVIISDAVPPGVWGFVGDFSLLFGDAQDASPVDPL